LSENAVFDQTFSKKVCAASLFKKGLSETVAPVYHQALRRLTTPPRHF